VTALQGIEFPADARERAERHLEGMAERRRRESALRSTDVAMAVRARKGTG
jgi:hypothetical protein